MRGLRRKTGALANSDAPPSYDGGHAKIDSHKKNGGHVKRPPFLFEMLSCWGAYARPM